ncbi:MAG TPA: serine/threonine-protein kinase [Gemmatimonadaceae bacterium]|nr:serine/threonine-protein kinase [Gemmatimonadaceae bacterium]
MSATLPPTAAADVLHRSLGDRYALERELGRGGMGAVYLARDLRLDRPVALKVLPGEYAAQPALRERFLRETRTAAGFSHPNIVPVYAVEESDDLLAYAMGLVEGETLTERVQRTGPLPVRELVRLLQDVGYALAYAHGRGVVHRDIKPDNVMVERATGRALVMDFGISRSIAAAHPTPALTRVGEVVGTPEYMSPEQASGDDVDGRSDLYALGLTAHFAATGRVTMTGESTQKILVRQLTEPVPPIAAARPDLPPALAAAIDRCVAKDPAHRFPTAEALVEAIDAAQLGEREIPVPVRLFAGELGTLSVLVLGVLLFAVYLVNAAQASDLSLIDTLLPVVLLLAVLLMRTLTTLSEGRRLAEAGFSPDEVLDGLRRVMAERARRRDELRADPVVRRRRRATIVWGAVMLAMAVTMVATALRLRVPLSGGIYGNPPAGIALVFSGFALLGMSVVLLLKSPFRMPPGERLFRVVWLGPLGRAFVRLAGLGARTRPAGIAVRPPAPAVAGPRATTGSRTAAARTGAVPATAAAAAPDDRIGALEARVAELERWRRDR